VDTAVATWCKWSFEQSVDVGGFQTALLPMDADLKPAGRIRVKVMIQHSHTESAYALYNRFWMAAECSAFTAVKASLAAAAAPQI